MRLACFIFIFLIGNIFLFAQSKAPQKAMQGRLVAYDMLLGQENPSAIPFYGMYLFRVNDTDRIIRLKSEILIDDANISKSPASREGLFQIAAVRDKTCDATMRVIAFADSFIFSTGEKGPPILRLRYYGDWRPVDLDKNVKCYLVKSWKSANVNKASNSKPTS